MLLAIAKKPSSVYHNKKNNAVNEALKGSHADYCNPQVEIIQRKSICSCDGGCPRCNGVTQAKLKIGQPNDTYELEAERVADEVMRMPEPVVSPQPT